MKLRIVATALLVMLLSVGLSQKTSAHPWGYRGGWYRPHVGIRVVVPPIPVPTPVVVNGYYGGGYANGYCGRDRYYGRGYYEPVPAYRGYYNRGWEHRENFHRDHRGYEDHDRGYRGDHGYYGPRGGRR